MCLIFYTLTPKIRSYPPAPPKKKDSKRELKGLHISCLSFILMFYDDQLSYASEFMISSSWIYFINLSLSCSQGISYHHNHPGVQYPPFCYVSIVNIYHTFISLSSSCKVLQNVFTPRWSNRLIMYHYVSFDIKLSLKSSFQQNYDLFYVFYYI